jgi:hypothetical protein
VWGVVQATPRVAVAANCALQEDEAAKTAEYLQQFLHRFRVGEPPMVIPRARPGVTPVLPVVGGPLHVPHAQAAPLAAAAAAAAAAAGGVGPPAQSAGQGASAPAAVSAGGGSSSSGAMGSLRAQPPQHNGDGAAMEH